jgi:multiple sugar transport system substrate-binding protein
MNSSKTAEALQWYADLLLKHKVSPSPSVAKTMGGAGEMFKTGKLAMFESGMWPLKDYKQMKELKFGITTTPLINGQCVGVLHDAGYVMSSQSKHKKEAWKFVKYIGGPEGQREMGKMGYNLPAISSIADELEISSNEYMKPFTDMVAFCTKAPAFMRTSDWSKIDEKLSSAMEATVLGKMTAKEALDKAVKDATDALKLAN